MAVSAVCPDPRLLPVSSAQTRDTVSTSKEYQIFARTIQHPGFWAILGTGVAIGLIVASCVLLPPLGASVVAVTVIALLAFNIYQNKEILYKRVLCELGLAGTGLKEFLGKLGTGFTWYTEITPHITLGANPLKTRGHDEAIADSHDAVLSMIEEHEILPYMTGIPTSPKDWHQKKGKITFLNIPSPDFQAVKDHLVDRGVEFVHSQISQGKRVYVHCNGGIGRSATVVVCYLMKHHKMNPQEAIDFVSKKRGIMLSPKTSSLVSFVERHGLGQCLQAAVSA